MTQIALNFHVYAMLRSLFCDCGFTLVVCSVSSRHAREIHEVYRNLFKRMLEVRSFPLFVYFLDFVRVGAKQRVKTSPVADKLVEQMPENLQVPTRKAEVILAQLYVGHTPKLHPVASYLNGTRCICPCRMGGH